MKRATGGNRFIDGDAPLSALMVAIHDGMLDLKAWAKETGREVDWGAVSVDTVRIPSGRISVTVSGDLTTPAPAEHPPARDRAGREEQSDV